MPPRGRKRKKIGTESTAPVAHRGERKRKREEEEGCENRTAFEGVFLVFPNRTMGVPPIGEAGLNLSRS